MGKKKRRAVKPWCWYCDRTFDDDGTLLMHQKQRHFRCPRCPKKLNTASGLVVHVLQVHKEKIRGVPNTIPGRDSVDIEIFGMTGVPEDDLEDYLRRSGHLDPAPSCSSSSKKKKKTSALSSTSDAPAISDIKTETADAPGEASTVSSCVNSAAPSNSSDDAPASANPSEDAPGPKSLLPKAAPESTSHTVDPTSNANVTAASPVIDDPTVAAAAAAAAAAATAAVAAAAAAANASAKISTTANVAGSSALLPGQYFYPGTPAGLGFPPGLTIPPPPPFPQNAAAYPQLQMQMHMPPNLPMSVAHSHGYAQYGYNSGAGMYYPPHGNAYLPPYGSLPPPPLHLLHQNHLGAAHVPPMPQYNAGGHQQNFGMNPTQQQQQQQQHLNFNNFGNVTDAVPNRNFMHNSFSFGAYGGPGSRPGAHSAPHPARFRFNQHHPRSGGEMMMPPPPPLAQMPPQPLGNMAPGSLSGFPSHSQATPLMQVPQHQPPPLLVPPKSIPITPSSSSAIRATKGSITAVTSTSETRNQEPDNKNDGQTKDSNRAVKNPISATSSEKSRFDVSEPIIKDSRVYGSSTEGTSSSTSSSTSDHSVALSKTHLVSSLVSSSFNVKQTSSSLSPHDSESVGERLKPDAVSNCASGTQSIIPTPPKATNNTGATENNGTATTSKQNHYESLFSGDTNVSRAKNDNTDAKSAHESSKSSLNSGETKRRRRFDVTNTTVSVSSKTNINASSDSGCYQGGVDPQENKKSLSASKNEVACDAFDSSLIEEMIRQEEDSIL